MKKIACIVLAVLMLASTVALAESTQSQSTQSQSVPSKTVFAMNNFTVIAENQPEDPNLFLIPVNELTVGEALPNYQEYLDVCDHEINKLAESATAEEYFVNVVDAEGNTVDLREMLNVAGEENAEITLDVFEFCPVVAGGFEEECGVVSATLLFSTPYEEDEEVLVLIGVVDEALLEEEIQALLASYATVAPDATLDPNPTPEPTAEPTAEPTTEPDPLATVDPNFEEEHVVTWHAFPGTGLAALEDQEETYGRIHVELTQDIVHIIQSNEIMTLMSVVSLPKAEEQLEDGAQPTPEATQAVDEGDAE